MRIFITLLVLIFTSQSLSKADEASEFQLEGMAIGESALNYYSREEIIDFINHPTSFEYKNNEFVQVGTIKNSYEIYDSVGITIKPNDNDYIIHSLAGQFNYGEDIEKCYSKQNSISQDIDEFIGESTKKYEWDGDYKYDTSGKSKVKYIDYVFKDDSAIRIICYDMSNEFIDPNDALYVVVNTVEFSKFLDTL